MQLIKHQEDNQLKMLNRSKASFWCYSDIISLTQIGDIKDEWWSNVDYRVVPKKVNLLELNSSKTDYTEESLKEDYLANNLEDEIIKQYEKLKAEGKKSILVFVPTIEFGKKLTKKNRNMQSISSKTSDSERERLINDFKSGKIDCLVNTGILTTGFDHPHLDGIIMARETNSFVLYYQIVGRLVRLLPDLSKTNGVFVDLTNTYSRFGKVDDISFEKQDYTKGWAMWNANNLMTNVYLNSGERVTREQQIKSYENQAEVKQDNKKGLKFTFGKYKGKYIKDVCEKNMGYIQWLLNNEDFKWFTEIMKKQREEMVRIVEQERLK